MSDNWIILTPIDPLFVPTASQQEDASRRLMELAPEADEVELNNSDTIQFFDCGANFERILCPACHEHLSTEAWQNWMNEDFAGDGFQLLARPMPCCGAVHNLNELTYEWPQAFGRFGLEAMNPNIGQLDPTSIAEFERILGTPIRVIYQHI
jgi:hypothetical protein